jgi:hypothetical protein
MKSIEQYIREKLGRSDAPADVDADDLWASIEQQLSPADYEPAVGTGPWKGLFFALLFLVIGGLGGWFFSNGFADIDGTTTSEQATTLASSEQAQPVPTATELHGRGTPAPTESSVHTPSESTPILQKTKRASVASSAEKKATLSTPSSSDGPGTANLAFKKPSTAPAAAPQKDAKPALEKAGSPIIKDKTIADLFAAKNNTQAENNAPVEIVADDVKTSAPRTRKFSAAALLPSPPVRTLSLAPVLFPPLSAAPTPPFKSTLTNRFSTGLNAGSNLLFSSHSISSDGPSKALNAAVKPAAGSSFGLDIRYQISKKFALSTGLEYHRTLNTFEHITEQATMIEHPSAYNSGPIDAILRRRVTDNLRTRYVSVPVLIHWNQNVGNLRLGLGAGVSINFRQFANGTTLDASGDFVPFDAQTGPATTPKTFLSYQFSPSAAYRLKPGGKLWLEAKANFNYLPFGTDALSGTNRSSILAGFGLGLRYSL